MGRSDVVGIVLVPGQTVRAEVIDHQPWGMSARIIGHEDVNASIDAAAIDSPSGSPIALPEERPIRGAVVTAVVQQIRGGASSSGYVRLTLRANDLAEFQWHCDFCMTPTTLSPGGDGVVMTVRSAEGPGGQTVTTHRACLVDALHPESVERARVTRVGYGQDTGSR
ncbi:hypothetical protein [Streptomonospora wellingtoniae]|uniref:S1 motif domain-containing protein n=1 Tax=Streptomonospora wellingtoniae TaxID=3075544 RepID=A0ABU2L1V4_9ACTN|nr:hypothetical protein [Streptomonospora sp. DSM 45055]MDT0305243.1 hypothetical protein [Streptomonospora sp. DSM 45055]